MRVILTLSDGKEIEADIRLPNIPNNTIRAEYDNFGGTVICLGSELDNISYALIEFILANVKFSREGVEILQEIQNEISHYKSLKPNKFS